MKKYVFMNTTDRAMGNAYKVYDTHSESFVVILCDSGIMGLNKALQSQECRLRYIRLSYREP